MEAPSVSVMKPETVPGVVLLVFGLGAGAVIYRDLSRRGWQIVVD